MGCEHDCSSCGANCQSKNKDSFIVETNKRNNIKKIIAVHSGKGGVGKSFVTCMLATVLAKKGYKVGILDADITGPSIPTAFGIKENLVGDGELMFPAISKTGIKFVSINLLVEDKTQPVAWRGPVLGGAIKQFYQDVLWEDIDFLFVDMPPGTGDVPLTVFQSLPIDGIIVITSPQDLVSMIVEKAVKMAKMMNIPIVGIVQNMSYFECPNCHEKHFIFGEGKVEKVAKEYDIKNVASLPISQELAKASDSGNMEWFEGNYLDNLVDELTK
jgi:Mrp family chromosome partitioning ATPase